MANLLKAICSEFNAGQAKTFCRKALDGGAVAQLQQKINNFL